MNGLYKSGARYIRRIGIAFIAVTLLVCIYMGVAQAYAAPIPENTEDFAWLRENYVDYAARYAHHPIGDTEIHIDIHSFTTSSTAASRIVPDGVFTYESGYTQWTFDVNTAGRYAIAVTYHTVEHRMTDIQRTLTINGAMPFAEAAFIVFERIWQDEGPIQQDINGHDLRPRQIEVLRSRTALLRDSAGFTIMPFQFFFDTGSHTLKLDALREHVIIESIVLTPLYPLPSYDEVLAGWRAAGHVEASAGIIRVQAQNVYERSNPTILPLTDRASPLSYPPSASEIRLNTIGRERWASPGQWLSWQVEIETEGLYKIVTRNRQIIRGGVFVSRGLRINGEYPFEEARRLRFNETRGWVVEPLGNGDEYFLFFFEPGVHVIEMAVSLGDTADIIMEVNDSLLVLNEIYRSILMITGATPDTFRDYQWEIMIPETLVQMQEQAQKLRQIAAYMEENVGGRGEQMRAIHNLAFTLETMYRDTDRIAARVGVLSDDVGALAAWASEAVQQPLELDWIAVVSPGETLQRAEAGFFAILWHNIRLFFASFTTDFFVVGNDEQTQRTVTVWLGVEASGGIPAAGPGGAVGIGGREQALIIYQLLEETFPHDDISINLQLMGGATLLPATLAGVGPCVALQVTTESPVNFALRNAVVDLTTFPDFDEVMGRFHPGAMDPFYFEGGFYALPETFTFPMMFVRDDIFAEMGLEIPTTWDDFFSLIPEFQRRNMSAGIPGIWASWNVYTILLFQSGVDVFNHDRSAVAFDNRLGISLFNKHVEFFTSYRLQLELNFLNRFRSGEMPIGIIDYATYNTLVVFAPEIRGRWSMNMIPGTPGQDGIVNHAVTGGGTAAVMLHAAEDPCAAWEFMKWWLSEETIARFALEVESVLGQAARFNPANDAAMAHIPWTLDEYARIMAQREWARGIPQAAGSYIVPRYFDFAFRNAVNGNEDPGRVLLRHVRDINEEITRKRAEFEMMANR